MDITQSVLLADTWGMHGDVGWGWMVGMMIVMLLFWAAIILGVVWLVRGGARWWTSGDTVAGRESPIEILERRFAEGEITAEEYRTRREVLVGGPEARE